MGVTPPGAAPATPGVCFATDLRLQTPNAFLLLSQAPEVLGQEVHPVAEQVGSQVLTATEHGL